MIQLTLEQIASLKNWFLPEQPGPLIGLHIIHTGHGHGWADRWPNPRALLLEAAHNYSFAGNPAALTPTDLKDLISGFVEAPDPFVPLLQETFPDTYEWARVMFELPGQPDFSWPDEFPIRRLQATDRIQLEGLSQETDWISKTWGGPAGLAASGMAWGAFAGTQLVSVACPFFVGERYEDIGVVTEVEYRGLGLSRACAGALCQDIIQRGRRPSWTTSLDNTASRRVAEKLGFNFHRHDRLFLVGIDIP